MWERPSAGAAARAGPAPQAAPVPAPVPAFRAGRGQPRGALALRGPRRTGRDRALGSDLYENQIFRAPGAGGRLGAAGAGGRLGAGGAGAARAAGAAGSAGSAGASGEAGAGGVDGKRKQDGVSEVEAASGKPRLFARRASGLRVTGLDVFVPTSVFEDENAEVMRTYSRNAFDSVVEGKLSQKALDQFEVFAGGLLECVRKARQGAAEGRGESEKAGGVSSGIRMVGIGAGAGLARTVKAEVGLRVSGAGAAGGGAGGAGAAAGGAGGSGAAGGGAGGAGAAGAGAGGSGAAGGGAGGVGAAGIVKSEPGAAGGGKAVPTPEPGPSCSLGCEVVRVGGALLLVKSRDPSSRHLGKRRGFSCNARTGRWHAPVIRVLAGSNLQEHARAPTEAHRASQEPRGCPGTRSGRQAEHCGGLG